MKRGREPRRAAGVSFGEVRRAFAARLARAGLVSWLLAIVTMAGVELLYLAATPDPGEPAPDIYYVVLVAGFFAPLYALYVVARRMGGVRKPFRGGRPLLRFAVIATLWTGTFGIGRAILSGALVLDYRQIASQWMVLLAYFVGWTLVLIRLVGVIPGLAIGEPSRHIRIMIRETGGSAVALGLAVLAFVVPFAAIAIALEVLGQRMLLDPAPALALAIVQGMAQAALLVMLAAIGVVAWDIAGGALRRSALRT